MSQVSRALRAAALAAVLAGCSSEAPTYQTEGEVVYADTGERVPASLTVWFESTTPPYQRSSGVVKDGKFYLSTTRDGNGAIAGEHRVRFDPFVPNGGAVDDPAAALARVMNPKHLEFRTSGIVVTIAPVARNTFQIKVEPPRGGRKKGGDKPAP
jgi:hypothetical protein